jgi:hypothetical protein
MTADNFCFYLQNRLIQTSQTRGQWYSDTSPLVFPDLTIESTYLVVILYLATRGLYYQTVINSIPQYSGMLITVGFSTRANTLVGSNLDCNYYTKVDLEYRQVCKVVFSPCYFL